MKVGTYYYPEQWPRGQWGRDLDRVVSMGLKIVHLGEFAWFDLEPSPGDFRLDWLADCVGMCASRNLDVILCTPTAAPPVWLSQTPGVLPIDDSGRVTRHGGRRHYTPTSPALRDAAARIVTALADRFGDHPSVIGWQIDNEYGSAGFDQSEATHAAFRDWLRGKYGTVEALNGAWHNQFWSQHYTAFDQVLMPPTRDPGYANPHHHLDASRFWSRAFADFNKLQADILKPRIGDRWIGTNFMPFHPDADPGDMADSLSLWSWDSYPLSGQGGPKAGEDYRCADPESIEFVHDQMASYNGRWALMEVQPGQINWSGYPVLPLPGTVRLWLWTAIAHGCEFVTVYRLRQPNFGVEQFHDGLLRHDGVTASAGGREFSQVAGEVAAVESQISNLKSGIPDSPAARRPGYRPLLPVADASLATAVGVLHDHDQLWQYATLPQAKRWHQPTLETRWHAAAGRLGLDVQVLSPTGEWPGGMRVLVVPAVQMVDAALVARLRSFAEAGGHLVLTCRTATMDQTGAHWEGPRAAPILDLIGGSVDAYDSLPAGTFGAATFGGESHRWGVWGDLLTPGEGTEVLATYADQFYAGAAAVTRQRVGKGVVTYCGVYDEGSLTKAVMADVARAAGLDTLDLPDRVRVHRRGGLAVALNYQATAYDLPTAAAPDGAEFLVGGRTLGPAGVSVWRA